MNEIAASKIKMFSWCDNKKKQVQRRVRMPKKEIIDLLRSHYSREVRQQLVQSMLDAQKTEDTEALEKSEKLISQIFSYVLKELGWTIAPNAHNWDSSALDIMKAAFSKIERTSWYRRQDFTPKKSIDVIMEDQ